MKSILKNINSALISDSTLTTLLGYNATTNNNILRFEGLEEYALNRMLLFGKLQAGSISDLSTSKVRTYYLELQALDRTQDIILDDIIDRTLEVLDNLKIEEVDEMLAPQIMWDGYISPTYYDNELNYYIKNIRFKMIVKKLN
jgi:hypothetical protein